MSVGRYIVYSFSWPRLQNPLHITKLKCTDIPEKVDEGYWLKSCWQWLRLKQLRTSTGRLFPIYFQIYFFTNFKLDTLLYKEYMYINPVEFKVTRLRVNVKNLILTSPVNLKLPSLYLRVKLNQTWNAENSTKTWSSWDKNIFPIVFAKPI